MKTRYIFIFLLVFAIDSCKKEDTNAKLAVLTTSEVINVESQKALCGGVITSEGGSTVTNRGLCWSIGNTPTIADSKTESGAGEGTFSDTINGLIPNTTYFVRAYATNKTGTSYGGAVSFTTEKDDFWATMTSVTNITDTSASFYASVFGYGITERGFTYSNPNEIRSKNGSGEGSFSLDVTGLTPGTSYWVKPYATNATSTVYGIGLPFKTKFRTLITTIAISDITKTTAYCGGYITNEGNSKVYERGVCWGTDTKPTIFGNKTSDGAGGGNYDSKMTGLKGLTTYYVRAYATNSEGTTYGNTVSFTTTSIPPLEVGQAYQGGIIFYIYSKGENGYIINETHGIIAATKDQGDSVYGNPWGCKGTKINTLEYLGWGKQNTINILKACPEPVIAAKICDELNLNGYTDWVLPSFDELESMYYKKAIIGGFRNYYYWSSTEDQRSLFRDDYALCISFTEGFDTYMSKNEYYLVRAIRYF